MITKWNLIFQSQVQKKRLTLLWEETSQSNSGLWLSLYMPLFFYFSLSLPNFLFRYNIYMEMYWAWHLLFDWMRGDMLHCSWEINKDISNKYTDSERVNASPCLRNISMYHNAAYLKNSFTFIILTSFLFTNVYCTLAFFHYNVYWCIFMYIYIIGIDLLTQAALFMSQFHPAPLCVDYTAFWMPFI